MMDAIRKIKANIDEDASRLETPCYVYDVDQILQNFSDIRQNLGTPLVLSLKANPSVDLLLRIQHALMDGIEVASLGELRRAASAFRGKIYLNSPAYDHETIRAALATKAALVIDNRSQITAITAVANGRSVSGLILRVNPQVLERFGAPRSRPDHFGLQWDDIFGAIHEIRESQLPLLGLHVFRGSYSFIQEASAYFFSIAKLIAVFREKSGEFPAIVNVGGGLGERWRESNIDFEGYRRAFSQFPREVKVIHEAGRAIFGSAGYFLTRVRYVKRGSGLWIVVCDGGISHDFLLCNTEGALRRYQTPHFLPLSPSRPAAGESAILVGPSCSSDDVIAKVSVGSPMPEPGDFFAFDYCGAYHSTYSVSNFLSLPHAREYVI